MGNNVIPVGKVRFVSGNVLDADADIICHQVNCMGKMGSGIALQVRNRFGYVYEEYKALCERCEPGEMIGTVLFRRGRKRTVADISQTYSDRSHSDMTEHSTQLLRRLRTGSELHSNLRIRSPKKTQDLRRLRSQLGSDVCVEEQIGMTY